MTTLRTERLLLRPPTLDDVDLAGELLGDERVMKFIGGGPVPRDAWPIVVEKWMQRWEDNGMGAFLLEHDGRFVGRCGMLLWDPRTWTTTTRADGGELALPELGWALTYEAWGHGYATEAARAVRDWVRAERGVTRLISVIAPANVASQRVAQRLGAVPVETVQLYDTGDAVVWEHPQPNE